MLKIASPSPFRSALPMLVGGALALSFAFAASAAPPAAPRDPFPSPTFVTLQGSNAVENLATGTTWQGLTSAHYVAVAPDGSRLLVSSASTEDAYLVDAHTGEKLATLHVGNTPQGVAIGPKGKWGIAVSAGNGTVSIIDIRTARLVKTIPVGKRPHNAIFTSDGKLAYVTLEGGSGVTVLDMQALRKVGEFPVPGLKMPHNLLLSPDGKTLWIRGFLGKAAAVDRKTHKVLAVIPVGPSHAGITITPNGRYVFTGGIGGDVVDVIDPKTVKVVKQINVGPGPHGVHVSANGRWVYAGVVGAGKVAVIDARTLDVVQQIPTGEIPFWIAVEVK